jgi:hypothetical protein
LSTGGYRWESHLMMESLLTNKVAVVTGTVIEVGGGRYM